MTSYYGSTSAGSSGPALRGFYQATSGATGNKTCTASATTPWVAHLVALNPRTLTVTATADAKTYDGTTTATAHLASTGILSGDTVTLNYSSATFSDKNVGTAKTVTVSGITLGGASAGNYILNNTTATTTANLTAKNLTISGAVANAKTYDGTTAATVSFTGASLVGVVSPDTVTINSAAYAATFADKNVGSAKAVTVTGVTLSGSGASNFTVAATAFVFTIACAADRRLTPFFLASCSILASVAAPIFLGGLLIIRRRLTLSSWFWTSRI